MLHIEAGTIEDASLNLDSGSGEVHVPQNVLDTPEYTDIENPLEDEALNSKKIMLKFNFFVGDRQFSKGYTAREFSEFNPEYRFLVAVGFSSSFVKSIAHQEEIILKLLNKEVKPEDLYTLEMAREFLSQLIVKGLVEVNESHFSLNAEAETVLFPAAENANSPTKVIDESEQTVEAEDKKPWPALKAGSVFRTIDDIVFLRQLTETNYTEPLYAPNNKEPIMPILAHELGLSTEALTGRLRRMREANFVHTKASRRGELTNIQLKEESIEYWKAVRVKLVEEGKILDEAEIEIVGAMTKTCIELAIALDEDKLAQSLRSARDATHLSEMKKSELDKEASRIEAILDRLRKDYAAMYAPSLEEAAVGV